MPFMSIAICCLHRDARTVLGKLCFGSGERITHSQQLTLMVCICGHRT